MTNNNSRLIGFLGKTFFPSQTPWRQRANVLMLLWAIATGVVTGGGIVAFVVFRGGR